MTRPKMRQASSSRSRAPSARFSSAASYSRTASRRASARAMAAAPCARSSSRPCGARGAACDRARRPRPALPSRADRAPAARRRAAAPSRHRRKPSAPARRARRRRSRRRALRDARSPARDRSTRSRAECRRSAVSRARRAERARRRRGGIPHALDDDAHRLLGEEIGHDGEHGHRPEGEPQSCLQTWIEAHARSRNDRRDAPPQSHSSDVAETRCASRHACAKRRDVSARL